PGGRGSRRAVRVERPMRRVPRLARRLALPSGLALPLRIPPSRPVPRARLAGDRPRLEGRVARRQFLRDLAAADEPVRVAAVLLDELLGVRAAALRAGVLRREPGQTVAAVDA